MFLFVSVGGYPPTFFLGGGVRFLFCFIGVLLMFFLFFFVLCLVFACVYFCLSCVVFSSFFFFYFFFFLVCVFVLFWVGLGRGFDLLFSILSAFVAGGFCLVCVIRCACIWVSCLGCVGGWVGAFLFGAG